MCVFYLSYEFKDLTADFDWCCDSIAGGTAIERYTPILTPFPPLACQYWHVASIFWQTSI